MPGVESPAQYVFENDKAYTVNEAKPWAEAVVDSAGRKFSG